MRILKDKEVMEHILNGGKIISKSALKYDVYIHMIEGELLDAHGRPCGLMLRRGVDYYKYEDMRLIISALRGGK